jgi:hypothetical protein
VHKNIARETAVTKKPPIFIFLFWASLFMVFTLTSCTTGDEHKSIDELKSETERHFGKMAYKKIVVPKDDPLGTELEVLTGGNSAKIRDEAFQYRWAVIVDTEGRIRDFYYGADNLETGGTAKMSDSEYQRRLKTCTAKPRGEKVTCINDLLDEVHDDCAAERMGTEGCTEHCFFDVCRWCGTGCGS